MSKGTNSQILGKNSKNTEPTQQGRPRINRDLIIANLKSKDALGNPRYTIRQVAKLCKCSTKTIQRVRDEAMLSGDLNEDYKSSDAIGIIEADFDSECIRAKGYSFKSWLNTKFKEKSSATTYFNFCSLVWEKLWNSCNLEELSDSRAQLGDQCAIKFLEEFGEDKERIRSRLKRIRFLFRFLGRSDINDRHLTMSDAKHPRNKRDIPEIAFIDFPLKFVKSIEECISYYPDEQKDQVRLGLWFKVSTQMRTGDLSDEREFFGIKKGTKSKSYIVMNSATEYRIHVYAKRGEIWDIIWLPPRVSGWLFERYNQIDEGDQLFSINVDELRRNWRKATKKIIGTGFILHDLRKVSLTWFYCNEIPLEVATNLNVGWKDLNTATSHYLNIKNFLRGSTRVNYSDNIPDWWKMGLNDFKGFEATIPNRS